MLLEDDGPTAVGSRPSDSSIPTALQAASPRASSVSNGFVWRATDRWLSTTAMVMTSILLGIVAGRGCSKKQVPNRLDVASVASNGNDLEEAPTPWDESAKRASEAPVSQAVRFHGGKTSKATAVRRGVDLLAQNRLSEALGIYRQLAMAHPERAVFRDIVEIIEMKLGWDARPEGRRGQCD